MPRFASLCGLSALALTLGACASAGADYPSLATREVERAHGTFAVTPSRSIEVPPVETDLSGPLDQVLASLVSDAETAHRGFLEAVPRAQRLAQSRGSGEVGSPAWAAAEVALADLESARSLAAIPLGDIDTLYTSARVAAQDVSSIEVARERILALIALQDQTLAQLRGRAD